MPTSQAPAEFVKKIKHRMETENLGIRQLARKIGVSHPTVTELVTYGKKPSFDTCLALAEWLNQSPVSVLREAGLLPPGPGDEIVFEDWKFLLDQLTSAEAEELREIAQMKIERRKRDESLQSLKPKKAKS